MSMKPKVENKAVNSQATPLANDVLGYLQRQIQGGTFGSGFGPLQQQAGTAIQQFVNSGGGQAFDRSPQIEALKSLHGFDLSRGMGDLQEQFGSIGGRFGTGLAQASGDYLSKSNAQFENTIGNLLAQDVQSRNQNMLGGIGMLGQLGQASMLPFWQMASMGINPENTIVRPSEMSSWMSGVSGLLQGIGEIVPG